MTDLTTGSTKRTDPFPTAIICAGVASSALTLAAVYLLSTYADFNAMGFYADYVIPIGALVVGVAAGSGYGLAAWWAGMKIGKAMLITVLVLQIGVYFTAQYIEFQHLAAKLHLTGVTFLQYYDWAARHFAWKQSNGQTGAPLGAWGYFFRLLEVLGFVIGGVCVPLILKMRPYCDACGVYMKKRALGLIPAGGDVKKYQKAVAKGKAAGLVSPAEVEQRAHETLERIRQLALAGDAAGFTAALAELNPGRKAVAKLPRYISITGCFCPRCAQGYLEAAQVTRQGRQVQRQDLGRTELDQAFVSAIDNRKTGGSP